MNVASVLLRADPRSIAVVELDNQVTYGQLSQQSARLAAALSGLGLHVGDRVALAMANTTAHVVTYFAVLRAGCVVVSVNPTATASELAHVLRLTRPKVVVSAAGLVTRLREAAASTVRPHLVSDVPIEGATPLDALREESGGALVPRDGADPAAILFTSGSTGKPKGVVLSHGNIAWAAGAQSSRMPARDDAVTALVAPLHHCYGQNAVLNAALSRAGAVALLDPRRKRSLVDDLRRLGVTALPTVPAMFRLLLDLGASGERLPRLDYAVSAAAELPRSVAEEWLHGFGFPIHEGYGLTETSPCALYNDKETSATGSLGTPFPGVRARVVDARGVDVPDGTPGVLLISGPNVMQGYLDDPQETAAVISGGWLRTGDYVRRDEHGDYWMVAREKNIILVAGANVFPSEVERVLADDPDVVEAAVVGRPHPIMGEMVVAFVQLRPEARGEDTLATLHARCAVELAPYKRPTLFRQVHTVPKLASGKPDLAALRALSREPSPST